MSRPSQQEVETLQHIGWLKMYAEGMSSENWRDMRDRIVSQLDQLRVLLRDGGEGDSESRALTSAEAEMHVVTLANVAVQWKRLEDEYTEAQEVDEPDARLRKLGFLTTEYGVLRRKRDAAVRELSGHPSPVIFGGTALSVTASKASGPQPPPQTSGEEGGT